MQRSENPDHYHRDKSDKGRPYEFVSLTQLLEDFYQRAEATLAELNISAITREVKATKENNREH